MPEHQSDVAIYSRIEDAVQRLTRLNLKVEFRPGKGFWEVFQPNQKIPIMNGYTANELRAFVAGLEIGANPTIQTILQQKDQPCPTTSNAST